MSLSLSSLLLDSAANYLGRRIGFSLDVASFKRRASAQDRERKGVAALGVCACYREEPLVLAFLLSVVKLIQSEITGYLRNAVLTVVSSI